MFTPMNKKVLVIVAHQDDETLFGGGLLTNISESCQLTLACMSRAKYKTDIHRRNEEFKKVCDLLNAKPILTNFQDSDSVEDSLHKFLESRPQQMEEMYFFLRELIGEVQPDMILTHNEVGEYGHCYHKVIHELCKKFNNIYNFGTNLKSKLMTVNYNLKKKEKLYSCYPRFNASDFCKRFLKRDISFAPETYFRKIPYQ